MKESLSLKFLYNTAPGRAVLKVLVDPRVSTPVGKLLDSGLSRVAIEPFKTHNGISLEGIDVPEEGFASFNDFFTRKREYIVFDGENDHFCSPCDGYLTTFDIDENSTFAIKHTVYSLTDLLKSPKLAKCFKGGKALVFRLTPEHYHRYHFIDDGEIVAQRKIPGVLHTVRPIATEKYPVYIRNSREYSIIKSENFGLIIQMEIGALLIGRICNDVTEGKVRRGQEKGRFEFGGSTIVVLTRKDEIELNEKFIGNEDETPVTVGDCLGYKK